MDIILQQDLKHQKIPVERICKVFENVNKKNSVFYSNPIFDLTDHTIKDNIKDVQTDIPAQQRGLLTNVTPLNLDIKMETGTGKTYVYTKTIYELHKRYGVNKFIVAVPSLAIKAGAKSFLSDSYVTKHFKNACGYNSEIDLQILSSIKNKSKKTKSYFPGAVREFVDGSNQIGNKIYVLLVNMQLLSGNSKILSDIYDNSVDGYYQPYEALRATHPFVIIDEPHKFSREQKAYKKIIDEIQPQCVIRFGATFPEVAVKGKSAQKDYINLLYDLNSYEAFNQNLIKGVAKEHFEAPENNDEKVKIVSINNRTSARFKYSKKNAQDKTFTLGKNDSMAIISPAFEGLSIVALDNNHVYFSNGQAKSVGEQFEVSAYMASYIEGMIKLAIDRHFEVEKENFNKKTKIKTLALFFIDDISSYRDKNVDGREPYLKNSFERLLKEKLETEINNLKDDSEYKEYLQASLDDISACHAGYFAQDNNDSDEEIEKEVQDILYNKKDLLSIKDKDGKYNTRRFLFSKWTLKEGWDNPNIFTICKLRSSGSENSKLQEVGRGLRLPVDEIGNRVSNEDFVLNYIVDFTEKDFADNLIKEINGQLSTCKTIDDKLLSFVATKLGQSPENLFATLLLQRFVDVNKNIIEENRENFYQAYPLFYTGLQTGKVIDRNKMQKNTVKIRPNVFKKLKTLWNVVNQKYLLLYDENVNENFQESINGLITPKIFKLPTLRSERVHIVANNGQMESEIEGGLEYNVCSQMKYNEFLKKISDLTSIPICILHNAFVNYSQNNSVDDNMFNNNTVVSFIQKFNEWKSANLQDKFKYQKMKLDVLETALTNADGSIKSEVVQGNVGTKICNNVAVSSKYLFDGYAYDSDLEKEDMLSSDINEVCAFAKIPKRSLEIPVIDGGTYSPDFMYVIDDRIHGKTLNLIIETKGVESETALRENERLRIENAKKFFESLQIDGNDVKFAVQLNNKTIKNIIEEALCHNGDDIKLKGVNNANVTR